MPPEVFCVWDFPTSSTVKYPACTDARARGLFAHSMSKRRAFKQHSCCDCTQKRFSVNVDR